MNRFAEEGKRHRELVQQALGALIEVEDIHCRAEGYHQPELYGVYRPDVTGIVDGKLWLAACKLISDLRANNKHSVEQVQALARFALEHNFVFALWVDGDQLWARSWLTKLGIPPNGNVVVRPSLFTIAAPIPC